MATRRPKEYRSKGHAHPYDTWLGQMDRHFAGVGDGPCGSLEDGDQKTEGVPLEGRCGNALPQRILPLTD